MFINQQSLIRNGYSIFLTPIGSASGLLPIICSIGRRFHGHIPWAPFRNPWEKPLVFLVVPVAPRTSPNFACLYFWTPQCAIWSRKSRRKLFRPGGKWRKPRGKSEVQHCHVWSRVIHGDPWFRFARKPYKSIARAWRQALMFCGTLVLSGEKSSRKPWLFFPWNNWKIREHPVDVALRTNGLMESEGLGGFKEGSYQLQEVGSGRGHRFWANSSRQPSHAQQSWPTDTHMSHVMLPVASSTEMSVLVLGPRLPRMTMSTMSLEITGKTHWPSRSVAPLKLSNVQQLRSPQDSV